MSARLTKGNRRRNPSRPYATAPSKGQCKPCGGRGITDARKGYTDTVGLPCPFCLGLGTM